MLRLSCHIASEPRWHGDPSARPSLESIPTNTNSPRKALHRRVSGSPPVYEAVGGARADGYANGSWAAIKPPPATATAATASTVACV